MHGEPYFINGKIADAHFIWTINGTETAYDPLAPNVIALRHVGGEGMAEIGLALMTKAKIPQTLSKQFQLIFQ